MKLQMARWQNKQNKQRKQIRRKLRRLQNNNDDDVMNKKMAHPNQHMGHPSPYEIGLRFCDRCGKFVKPWFNIITGAKRPQCFNCHTWLRVQARKYSKSHNVVRY